MAKSTHPYIQLKTLWDPKMDQILMWRSMGISLRRMPSQLTWASSGQRLKELSAKYGKIGPPTWEERLEKCETLSHKILAANLMILACRIRGSTIPRFLLSFERQALSGLGRKTEVLEAMRLSGADLSQTDWYVTHRLAPELLTARLQNPWRRRDRIPLHCLSTDSTPASSPLSSTNTSGPGRAVRS